MQHKNYVTSQEAFWAGEFGSDYIGRNDSAAMVATNLNTFCHALKYMGAGVNPYLRLVLMSG